MTFETEIKLIDNALTAKNKQIEHLLNFVERMAYLHADNPSDTMGNLSPLDYHKHIMSEVRREARQIFRDSKLWPTP